MLGGLGRRDHLVPNRGLRRWIERHLDITRLEDAELPVHVVATEVGTGMPVLLSEGSATEALLASCAIPGVFPPVEIGGRLLIDGGVAAVSVCDQLAAGTISSTEEIGFAEVRYDRDIIDLGKDDFDDLERTVAPLPDRGVQAEVGGPLAAWEQATETSSEQIGLLIAIVVLLFAFGSVTAKPLPIGMAISIGHSLFIVTRFREARRSGTGVVEAAAQINVNTELRHTYRTALERQSAAHPHELATVKLVGPVIDAVQAVVEAKIAAFGSAGQSRR